MIRKQKLTFLYVSFSRIKYTKHISEYPDPSGKQENIPKEEQF